MRVRQVKSHVRAASLCQGEFTGEWQPRQEETMLTYEAALDYIYRFTDYEQKSATRYAPENFDLARMERLLAQLGNPHREFSCVHVAGTKGKGSTSAMIASILEAAGYRVGLFTSPHLHTFRERIRVDGGLIHPQEVAGLIERMQPCVEEVPGITTFEIITALALLHFLQRKVDLAVLEVGLGGRLDATNVITPEVAVITSLSYDHMYLLGNTLAEIATEKAGIIKPGVPVVSSPQESEARRSDQGDRPRAECAADSRGRGLAVGTGRNQPGRTAIRGQEGTRQRHGGRLFLVLDTAVGRAPDRQRNDGRGRRNGAAAPQLPHFGHGHDDWAAPGLLAGPPGSVEPRPDARRGQRPQCRLRAQARGGAARVFRPAGPSF